MDICATVIVKHKFLLDDVLEMDKIHVDIFDCIKKAMKKNSKTFKKYFSTSYKLPYSIVLASSPPSELQWQWKWKGGIEKECLGDFDCLHDDHEEVSNTWESESPEMWEVEMDQCA